MGARGPSNYLLAVPAAGWIPWTLCTSTAGGRGSAIGHEAELVCLQAIRLLRSPVPAGSPADCAVSGGRLPRGPDRERDAAMADTSSSLRKSLQRQLYSLVSSRTALAVAIVLLVVTLNSAFQLVESLVEWSSAAQLAPRLDPFRNNIASTSYQERLCAPVPIDIVYTWVNGSDPKLQAGTSSAWGAQRLVDRPHAPK